jgi:hypothetical protein
MLAIVFLILAVACGIGCWKFRTQAAGTSVVTQTGDYQSNALLTVALGIGCVVFLLLALDALMSSV